MEGARFKIYEYDSFGNEIKLEKKDENPFRYCGEYYDKETEEIYLRARYYQPAVGRFLTRDTYTGEEDEPLSLHLYAYCGNDGVNHVDPSGHDAIWLQYKYAAGKQGHTGLLIQHPLSISTWYYFFWGPQKAGLNVLVFTEPRIVLEEVKGMFSTLQNRPKKLKQSIYRKTNKPKYYTEKLTGIIYFRGNFALTYMTCAVMQDSVKKNKGEFAYNLYAVNCLQVSIAALSNGTFEKNEYKQIIKNLKGIDRIRPNSAYNTVKKKMKGR